jgi:hypothetical protein
VRWREFMKAVAASKSPRQYRSAGHASPVDAALCRSITIPAGSAF